MTPLTPAQKYPKEPHYTIRQLANWWNVHYETARREVIKAWKRGEDIRRFSNSKPDRRKRYIWRVPESVATRMYKRLTAKGVF
jgi:hypothetical protein